MAVRLSPARTSPAWDPGSGAGKKTASMMAALSSLRVILALGRIAHESTLDALALKRSHYPFTHGARHALATGQILFDSYHCSRQNTNTGRLTTPMFEAVIADIASAVGSAKQC